MITINSTLWERFVDLNKEQRLLKKERVFLGVRRQLENNVNTGIYQLQIMNQKIGIYILNIHGQSGSITATATFATSN